MSTDNKKKKRGMSYFTKWIITLILLVTASTLVVICITDGMFDFRPGSVRANDDEPEATAAVIEGGLKEPELSKYTVFVTAGNGGTANPNGQVSVDAWGSVTVSFTPDEGYAVQSVTVDGEDMGSMSSYTLSYVVADHSIMVTFSKVSSD